jgi:hypothetical protein
MVTAAQPFHHPREHTMKSMFTMMIATLLLASGCATMDVGGEDAYTGNGDEGFNQLFADNSPGE